MLLTKGFKEVGIATVVATTPSVPSTTQTQ
ncbi:hypothetical protein LMG29660_07126 [Burkholderia puraquae]|uniref:Uncharacterized protein n=1 Tax=Burkholderia puraquae TaxID=1904757 RepID=A0A6J5F0G6_9BURK|nr:hypothetical protein LMG29660_07126 [Burkholderia puraquae]